MGKFSGRLAVILLLTLLLGSHAAKTQSSNSITSEQALSGVDQDPLRHYLPDSKLYMPVPGGVSALTTPSAEAETIEDRAAQLHGGLIVGYCLRASCSYVTHLVVIQVCNNQISGPDGADKLVLGIVRLPHGKKAGHLTSLQGQDYAYNFQAFGPYKQPMPIGTLSDKVEALYALAADGMGPIAPLDYLGQQPKQPQSSETLALHMSMYQNDTGTPYPYFQVRHVCQQPIS